MKATKVSEGYVRGNLFISFIAGMTLVLCFLVLGLPYVLALGAWIDLFDLVPLIGEDIGELSAVVVVFLRMGIRRHVCDDLLVCLRTSKKWILQPHVMGKVILLSSCDLYLRPLRCTSLRRASGSCCNYCLRNYSIILTEYIKEQGIDHH